MTVTGKNPKQDFSQKKKNSSKQFQVFMQFTSRKNRNNASL